MGRPLRSLAVIVATLALGAYEVWACGDKFLVVNRPVRSQRMLGAVHVASILVYLSARGHMSDAMTTDRLETNLRLAGHRLHSVSGAAALGDELRNGSYDLVLADIVDVAAVAPAVEAAASHPVLLPVIYNPTGEELNAATSQYSCLLRSTRERQHVLAVIDDALVLRRKQGPAGLGR